MQEMLTVAEKQALPTEARGRQRRIINCKLTSVNKPCLAEVLIWDESG